MSPAPLTRPDIAMLLQALRDPGSVLSRPAADFDLLVRSARRAKLLGTLHVRLDALGALSRLPEQLSRHLDAANALALYRRQMAIQILESLRSPLQGVPGPVVLLKGTAYVAQHLQVADGRVFADVDIMVPRACLDETESHLLSVGWKSTLLDAYDQRYYRQWSHELPPMAHPAYPLTLDLHHTILPVTGRAKVDPHRLFADALPLPGTPWHVLSPVDQVLHASVHLYQDSDCDDRLRDLVDLHALIVEHSLLPDFWSNMVDRALRAPSLGRPLWYALRHARAWLGTPVPGPVLRELVGVAPSPPVRAFMDRAVARVIGGPHVDARSASAAPLWSLAMKARAMFLRMPLHLLAYHAVNKSFRSRT